MTEIDYQFIAKRRAQKRQEYLKHRNAYLRRAKVYYQKNKQKCKTQAIKWNREHPRRRKEIISKYRQKNIFQTRKKAEQLRFINKDEYNKYARDRYAKRKLIVMMHYSKNGKCQCCGESTIEFLTIDHITQRKLLNHLRGFSGRKLYDWLIQNNFPDGFQVLCFNCNFAKWKMGRCPHQRVVIT